MAYSIQRAVSDGTLSTLPLDIEFFEQSNIAVYVDDLLLPNDDYSYTWSNDITINITPVVPSGIEVVVRRTTPYSDPLHVFKLGAVFNDSSMDENFKQILYITQEAVEGNTTTDFYKDLNFHGYRLTNVGSAVSANDAVPLEQYQADANGAYQQRVLADAAKVLAQTYASNSSTSATNSANSASASATSASAASASATTASTQATNASTSATNAANSATAAANAYDAFDDRYLGSKASDPTVDNDGGALLEGALYWNTTAKNMRVYDGSTWVLAYVNPIGFVDTSTNQSISGIKSFNSNPVVLGDASAALQLVPKQQLDANINTRIASTEKGAANGVAPLGSDSKINALYLPSSGTPTGTMLPYAGTSAPTGYLLANGAALSRTTYADLFAVIGTTYGVGDGSTTFNLPDTRGVSLRGYDNGRGLDSGRVLGSYQGDALASHSITISDPGHSHAIVTYPAGSSWTSGAYAINGTRGSNTMANNGLSSASSTTTGITASYSGATETRMKNLAVNYIIKY